MRATWGCCPVATFWDLPPRSCPWAAGWTAWDPAKVQLGFWVWPWSAVWCSLWRELFRTAGRAGAGWRRRQCLPDGAADGLPTLVHAHGADAGQRLDADDRFDRHGRIHAARAVASALGGMAPAVLGLAVLIVLAMGWMALAVPAWPSVSHAASPERALPSGYAAVWQDRYFQRLAPLGFLLWRHGGHADAVGRALDAECGRANRRAGGDRTVLDQHGDAGHLLVLGHGQPLAAAPGAGRQQPSWPGGCHRALLVLAGIVVLGPQAGAGPGPCFASAAPLYPCRYRPWP